MHTPKKRLKTQKRIEPHAFDQIAPLFELIADFVIAECKDTESSDPKVRQRAEENVFELGLFGMKFMEELYPLYLHTKARLEELRPLVREAIGQ